MKKIIIILISTLLIKFTAFSQIETGDISGSDRLNTITTAVPFLIISPDSKAGAMGDVGVATEPDANSLHWNPAKYAFVNDDMGFAVSYVPWLRALVPDINLSYLSGYKRLSDNETVGMELRYFSLGDITFTDIVGTTIGQYKPSEFSLASSYSRKLSRSFSLAIAGRYIYSNLTGGQAAAGIPTVAGQSIAADVAGYFQKPVRIAKQDMDLAIGCNISNIGSKISYTETAVRNFIPINLRLGTSIGTDFDEYNKISLAFDINKLLVPTPPEYENGDIVAGMDPDVSVVSGMIQSFWDAPGGFKEEFREINYSIGTEYWYANQFAIRTGYFFEHDTKGG